MFSASLLSKIERRIARAVVKRPMALQLSAPTVTFTFDDVPQSACVRGRALLERHDATGTFYVCGGYTGTVREQPMHTRGDLLSVLAAGHELGCHGFAHLDHQAIGPGRAADDMDRNRRFLQELGVADVHTLNFAYPFGCVNAGIKRVVHSRYRSARGVVGGQHQGVVDANLLGAVPLYDATITPQAVADLIEANARQRGWLVFFTHGVLAQPGPFDCSPTLLAHALAAARDTGSLIQSVQATMGPQRARAAQPEAPIASRAA